MEIRFLDNLKGLDAARWNALSGTRDPFTRYEFLAALEHHGCAGREFGWVPHHAVGFEAGVPVAACPLYIKDNSYGELVFDHAWADAYQRHGRSYYPKLVSAIPYTPATGRRLLTAADPVAPGHREELAGAIRDECARLGYSGVHWLFPGPADRHTLESMGFILRLGTQYHWHNRDYRDFDEFLLALSSTKRKKVRRERRRVTEQGIRITRVRGDEASEEQWRAMHRFYLATFDRKWGIATLNLPFFFEIARTLGDQILLVLAHHAGRCVAGALFFRSDDTLYGRHWGASGHFDSLHFEVCYYQGIEYCIREGLERFEPGAQGEYKISRGFLPAATWSAHWIADPMFRAAIARHVAHERELMREYMDEQAAAGPYRQEPAA